MLENEPMLNDFFKKKLNRIIIPETMKKNK